MPVFRSYLNLIHATNGETNSEIKIFFREHLKTDLSAIYASLLV